MCCVCRLAEVASFTHPPVAHHLGLSYSDPYNTSDEKKLRYSSTSLTPEKRPHPTAHQWSTAEGGELVSSPTGSSGSSNSRKKLTRKKWLETSEGGLLFGSPQLYRGQGTDSEHKIHRPSCSASVQRLVPRSPQTQASTIARQPMVKMWQFGVFQCCHCYSASTVSGH